MKIAIAFVIGILITLLGFQIEKNLVDKKTDDSKAQLFVLKERLLKYKAECGHFPQEANGLHALVDPSLEGCSKPAILEVLVSDPWDGEITYLETEQAIFIVPSNEEGGFARISK